ncbi:L-rhamnose-binding lectin SML-like [Antennarius striatus]|uniref:L-rhamnose-binding lectin SML-like n=1 Tax=Antennarius striatus TaxID=241820 RepID=UPI0035B01282
MLRLITTLLLVATCLLCTEGMLVLKTETVVTCGDPSNVHRLSCDKGVISIESAFYGRKDSKTCSTSKSPAEISNTACSDKDILEVFQYRCNGKRSCETTVKSIQNPDPCPGTDKYLQTVHNCLPAFNAVACENEEAKLKCDIDDTIGIFNANYGRLDVSTCTPYGWFSHYNVDNCRSVNTIQRVNEICKGKTYCTVPAKNSVFGDNCPGVHKYLTVDYVCFRSSFQCQDWRIRLSCFGGPVLSIYESVYGRLDNKKCAYGQIEEKVQNTNCSVPAPIISEMCDGKPFCDIHVSASLLGDPCPETHKYLEMSYACVPKP